MVEINLSNINTWAILESRATSHVLISEASTLNDLFTNDPPRLKAPNRDQVQLPHTCTLAHPQLGHIVARLASYSLLSVVRLCNARWDIMFTKINYTVRYRGHIVMTVSKDINT